jgi:cytoskeletal protein RodZ
MSKNKKKSNNMKSSKKALSLLVLVVLVVAGLFVWRHYHTQAQVATDAEKKASTTINYSASTPADNAENNARKTSTTPAQTLDNGSSQTPSVPVSVTVTRAGVIGSNLEVGTLVNGTTGGTCTLNVSQTGQQTVTKNEDVTQQNNSYSCPVFSIPVSSFPNQNNWNVSVTVTVNGSSQTGQWQANPVNLSNND